MKMRRWMAAVAVMLAAGQVLAGQPVSADQQPSVGCGIKWKPGREPAYTTQ